MTNFLSCGSSSVNDTSYEDSKEFSDVSDKRAIELAAWNPFSKGEKLRHKCLAAKIPIVSLKQYQMWLISGKKSYLSCGGFGKCYKLELPSTVLVLKQFTRKKKGTFQIFNFNDDLIHEAKMLARCQGSGVQELVGVCVETETLITGFAGKTLKSWLRNGELTVHDRAMVLSQVMRTIRRGLKRKICHNDIRCVNICVKRRRLGDIETKLIDYGSASKIGMLTYSSQDDPYAFSWIAPELLKSKPCSEESEVYSVAQLAKRMQSMRVPYPEPFQTWISRGCSKRPELRPTLAEGIKYVNDFKNVLSRTSPTISFRTRRSLRESSPISSRTRSKRK